MGNVEPLTQQEAEFVAARSKALGDQFMDFCLSRDLDAMDIDSWPDADRADFDAASGVLVDQWKAKAQQLSGVQDRAAMARARVRAHRAQITAGRLNRAAALIRAARVAAAVRRVKTPAGEKRYGAPIGTPIPVKGVKKPAEIPDKKPGAVSFKGKTIGDLLDDADKAAATRDHDTLEKIVAEVDRRETANARARERRAAAKTAKQKEQDTKFDHLTAQGLDEETAVERAYGVPVEKQRKIQAIATLRNWGFQGRTLDELVKSWHGDESEIAYRKAENATNGHMVKRKYEGKIGYRDLWNVNDATARKYASDELLEWWDEHGRVTSDLLKASILDPKRFNDLIGGRKDYLR